LAVLVLLHGSETWIMRKNDESRTKSEKKNEISSVSERTQGTE